MSKYLVNLNINNTPVSVEEGTTILEAAKKINFKIPHSATIPTLMLPVTAAFAWLK
jgi:predicted molibdopterin-dependent oxidoreductase YjgC